MRRGLTLAELVLSLMVVTLVMGAATSAVLLVTRAAPASAGEAAAAGAAAEALHRIGVELRYATALTRQHARRPAFLVADRGHGAAGPEQIEYEWSGAPGDPLVRRYNGASETLLERVHAVRFEYQVAQGLSGSADDRLGSIAVQVQLTSDTGSAWRTEVMLLNELDPDGNAVSK